jgi:adenylosuccinate synthase
LCSAYVANTNPVDLAITNSSPNAGHTFYLGDDKMVVSHLPVAGVIHKRSLIYLCAGSIINPKVLLDEIEENYVSSDNVFIHPRAAVITDEDISSEQSGMMEKISSTQSGVGSALSRKILRTAKLAKDMPDLRRFICKLDIAEYLDCEMNVLMEVPQGLGLSLNSGLSYPYCTSREITVSGALSDVQLHPHYIGKVVACMRTFPIRVGNLENGYSGPFYHDSEETTWEDIGVSEEYTTKTNRVRRVATFSMEQYRRMLIDLRPDYVFLNFANYLDNVQLGDLLKKLPEVTHLGYGPYTENVISRNNS